MDDTLAVLARMTSGDGSELSGDNVEGYGRRVVEECCVRLRMVADKSMSGQEAAAVLWRMMFGDQEPRYQTMEVAPGVKVPYLGEVQTLTWNPGDTLVFRSGRTLPVEERDLIMTQVIQHLEGINVLLLGPGDAVQLLKKGEIDVAVDNGSERS